MGANHMTILTTAHPLDDVRVNQKFRESLLAAGWSVSWIGPDRFIFEESLSRRADPQTKLFKSSPGKIGRLRSMLNASYSIIKSRPKGWIYCPDPDAALLALLWTRRRHSRVVFDIHEDFHNGPLENWVGRRVAPVARRALLALIRAIAKRSTIVISVNDSLSRAYAGDHPNALVMRNMAPSRFAEDYVPRKRGGPIRLFHGKTSRGNGTPIVLQAIRHVEGATVTMIPHSLAPGAPNYWDGFDEQLRDSGSRDKVAIVDPVPHHQMAKLLDNHSVGMIAYGRTLGVTSLPNRLFEYMARGLAVMVPSYSKEIVPIVRN